MTTFQAKGLPLGELQKETVTSGDVFTLPNVISGSVPKSCRVQIFAGSGELEGTNKVCFFRADGTTITVNNGMVLGDTDIIEFNAGELAAGVDFIAYDGASTFVIYYQYYAN